MKVCPNCKAVLDDNARFCLQCMTSLEEKEQIQPPMVRYVRRWPLVLLCVILLGVFLLFMLLFQPSAPEETTVPTQAGNIEDPTTITQTLEGVTYTFRPATKNDYPAAIVLTNHFVLIRVEGTPLDGTYQVPSFVGDNKNALVTVVAENAFAGTNARSIDLGYNVRLVWGNAFGGYPLMDLYLHEDVWIDQEAFSGCAEGFTIHCPDDLENTKGVLWSELAATYGFRWEVQEF